MNTQAEQHLAKAKDFLGKGDEFYRKAAEEIEAALEADRTLSQAEVSRQIGKGATYVSYLRSALSRARNTGEPFRVDWQSGSNRREDIVAKALRETPAEEVQSLVAELDPQRQIELAKALAGSDTAEKVTLHHMQKRDDDREKRRQEKLATMDPAVAQHERDRLYELEQVDFAARVVARATSIRIDVLDILRAIREFDGSYVGNEEIERARQLLRTTAEQIVQAADAMDEVAEVDIDALVVRLQQEA
jgi:hypothetical protein